ncbi:MAG: hypothetical protein EZS28_012956 [Streblomastix strix]|uniref:Uncharacterized protein n=1 Tax=Streblomastix strix TaxID=222440 RepID=A0A5J4WAF9_9EUKA|nr:MAG: hypothetical protein EZS28_012956 [Streblomastix strix]
MPKYGFGLLTITWLINGIWLIIAGIEGIIYSIRAGGKSYKVILIMSAFFVGAFFFWSILMINPNGFENIFSIEKQSLSNIIDNQLMSGLVQSNNIVNDYHSALQFSGIDILIQSVVSGSKIATQFALDMDKDLPFV